MDATQFIAIAIIALLVWLLYKKRKAKRLVAKTDIPYPTSPPDPELDHLVEEFDKSFEKGMESCCQIEGMLKAAKKSGTPFVKTEPTVDESHIGKMIEVRGTMNPHDNQAKWRLRKLFEIVPEKDAPYGCENICASGETIYWCEARPIQEKKPEPPPTVGIAKDDEFPIGSRVIVDEPIADYRRRGKVTGTREGERAVRLDDNDSDHSKFYPVSRLELEMLPEGTPVKIDKGNKEDGPKESFWASFDGLTGKVRQSRELGCHIDMDGPNPPHPGAYLSRKHLRVISKPLKFPEVSVEECLMGHTSDPAYRKIKVATEVDRSFIGKMIEVRGIGENEVREWLQRKLKRIEDREQNRYVCENAVNPKIDSLWHEARPLTCDNEPILLTHKGDRGEVREWRLPGGAYHRTDGPALIRTYDKEQTFQLASRTPRKDIRYVREEVWFDNGKMHRKNAPAQIFYDGDKRIVYAAWWEGGEQTHDSLCRSDRVRVQQAHRAQREGTVKGIYEDNSILVECTDGSTAGEYRPIYSLINGKIDNPSYGSVDESFIGKWIDVRDTRSYEGTWQRRKLLAIDSDRSEHYYCLHPKGGTLTTNWPEARPASENKPTEKCPHCETLKRQADCKLCFGAAYLPAGPGPVREEVKEVEEVDESYVGKMIEVRALASKNWVTVADIGRMIEVRDYPDRPWQTRQLVDIRPASAYRYQCKDDKIDDGKRSWRYARRIKEKAPPGCLGPNTYQYYINKEVEASDDGQEWKVVVLTHYREDSDYPFIACRDHTKWRFARPECQTKCPQCGIAMCHRPGHECATCPQMDHCANHAEGCTSWEVVTEEQIGKMIEVRDHHTHDWNERELVEINKGQFRAYLCKKFGNPLSTAEWKFARLIKKEPPKGLIGKQHIGKMIEVRQGDGDVWERRKLLRFTDKDEYGQGGVRPYVCQVPAQKVVSRSEHCWIQARPIATGTPCSQAEPPAKKKPEHVCGLQGFGHSLNDVCPACEAQAKEWEEKKEKSTPPPKQEEAGQPMVGDSPLFLLARDPTNLKKTKCEFGDLNCYVEDDCFHRMTSYHLPDGRCHREDGAPAYKAFYRVGYEKVSTPQGEQQFTLVVRWYKDGVPHREDGPAAIWYLHGKEVHREYYLENCCLERFTWEVRRSLGHRSVACHTNDRSEWRLGTADGLLHRIEGPAVEWTNGLHEWWLFGVHVAVKDHKEWVKLLECEGSQKIKENLPVYVKQNPEIDQRIPRERKEVVDESVAHGFTPEEMRPYVGKEVEVREVRNNRWYPRTLVKIEGDKPPFVTPGNARWSFARPIKVVDESFIGRRIEVRNDPDGTWWLRELVSINANGEFLCKVDQGTYPWKFARPIQETS